MADSGRTITSATANQHKSLPKKDQRNSAAFQFSAAYNGEENIRRNDREQRVSSQQRPYKSQTRQWHERSSFRRSSQARERTRYADERSSRPSREYSHQRHIPAPPSRSYYREISRKVPEARETGSSASKNIQEINVRGTPRAIEATIIPQEAISKAMGELRNVMLQYTKCANPTEREARKERVRQAEEKGEMEESAIQMARASLNATVEKYQEPNDVLTPERIPVTQRLGPSPIQLSNLGVKNLENSKNNSQDRLPATLRLGPSVALQANNQSFVNSDREEPAANDPIPARIPAAQRITLPSEPQGEKDGADEAKSAKKKRGRPPGKRTISGSPKLMQGEALVDPRNDGNLIQQITAELETAYKAEEELGDRNTGYFHAVTKKRRRANSLTVLEDSQGSMVYKEEDITRGSLYFHGGENQAKIGKLVK
ncbi:hypothetical protein Bca52824_074129 [Brassica carinata]|uniref:Uncharacterized protein n=1 Tax=Brassica carinata TaxID=52824 RepID=A0A8X7QBE0_BRACI|nr:hypothetical protein Bca52824_074129 [Brassica carinata]